MAQNVNELKSKIVEMNLILDSIKHSSKADGDALINVKTELDSLLYKYFKMLRCG